MIEQELVQGLKQCGMNKTALDRVLKHLGAGNQDKAVAEITACRRECLDKLHEHQKRIDLLDYLIYQMKQGK